MIMELTAGVLIAFLAGIGFAGVVAVALEWLPFLAERGARPAEDPARVADEPADQLVAAVSVESKPRVRINKDGWVRHVAGPFPFDPHTIVETVHADGLAFLGRNAEYARFWHETWWVGQADSWRRNIMFYRIVRCPGQLAQDPVLA